MDPEFDAVDRVRPGWYDAFWRIDERWVKAVAFLCCLAALAAIFLAILSKAPASTVAVRKEVLEQLLKHDRNAPYVIPSKFLSGSVLGRNDPPAIGPPGCEIVYAQDAMLFARRVPAHSYAFRVDDHSGDRLWVIVDETGVLFQIQARTGSFGPKNQQLKWSA